MVANNKSYTLEEYLQKLHRKYGPTFPIEASISERKKLIELRKAIDLRELAFDKHTCD